MNDEQSEKLIQTIAGHGDQLGGNLVHLKQFLGGQEAEQRKFLAEQREASDRAQEKANRTAVWAAVAAVAAAVATIVQASVAIVDWRAKEPISGNATLTEPATATLPAAKRPARPTPDRSGPRQ